LRPGDTRMLLSPNSQFFQYFNSAFGKGVQNAAPSPPGTASPPDQPSGNTGGPEQGGAGASTAIPEPNTAAGDAAPPAPQTP
jgi:modulator of FtsH protease HflC